MRQGPFYLGEDTFKEPKGKMIFYQCLSLFTFVCIQRRMIIAIYCMIQVHCLWIMILYTGVCFKKIYVSMYAIYDDFNYTVHKQNLKILK